MKNYAKVFALLKILAHESGPGVALFLGYLCKAESWQVSERTIRSRLKRAVEDLTQAILATRGGAA